MSTFRKSEGPWFQLLLCVFCSLGTTSIIAALPVDKKAATVQTQVSTVYPSSLSIYAQPLFAIPLSDSSDYFGLGGALSLGAEYSFQGNPQLFLNGGLDYAFFPVKDETSSVSLLSALAGGGMYFWFTPRLAVKVAGQGGYYLGFLNSGGAPSGHIALQGGLELEYLLVPALNLSLGAAYRYDLGTFQGLVVTASFSYFLRGTEGRRLAIEESRRQRIAAAEGPKTPEKGHGLEMSDVELFEIFPVFHKFYDDHPVGKVILRNLESKPISDIKLTFLIKQYMDSPKKCPAPTELAAGANQPVEIMSLLTDRVLGVTEPTKVAADLILDYRMDGELYRDTQTLTVRLLDRNAMSWDDDRKAASFVTAKDPAVLAVSKAVAGLSREQGLAALNPNLRAAMGLFTAMELYGLSYVVDPKTPFVEFSKDESLVDYLQFPRQTLGYKGGDCDDLSILFSALLESVGVETAFVTVPGHIFLAFSTGLSAEEASRAFASPRELILESGEGWVPVETTVRKGGFMKAWAEGAKQWREATSRGTAGFHRIHAAWQVYEPVGLPGTVDEIVLPDQASLSSALRLELERFVDREVSPRVAQLEESIRKSGGDPPSRNKLGILYAQYGRYAQAETEFRKAVTQQDYVPALVNLGNLFVLQGQPARAQEFYERAARKEPRNSKVLLGLSHIYHETEQYDKAKAAYQELESVDRPLAERYGYLGGGADTTGRASAVDTLGQQILWVE
jgi:tetratricopeptide (TPR) repeat protein